jgi:uncharacterized Zn-binding protein involved in type VI secretion
MASNVARRTDTVSNISHGCTTQGEMDLVSTNVFANGLGVARHSDKTDQHTIPTKTLDGYDEDGVPQYSYPCLPHRGSLSSSASTVYVNGRLIGRKGDRCDTGTVSQGSGDVFAD